MRSRAPGNGIVQEGQPGTGFELRGRQAPSRIAKGYVLGPTSANGRADAVHRGSIEKRLE